MVRVPILLLCATATGVFASSLDFYVNTAEDVDGGECPATTKHKCSYRTALFTATQMDTVGPINIYLPAEHFRIDYNEEGKLPLPQLQILTSKHIKNIAIYGTPAVNGSNGTVLDGIGQYQLLKTQTGINIDVSDITFVNGHAASAHSLDHREVDTNNGGAIENDGIMRIRRCHFFNNRAEGAGGAVQNTGDLDLDAASFEGNHAIDGGALASTGSAGRPTSLTARSISFAGNHASQSAGALQNIHGAAALTDVTFDDHSAYVQGVGGTIQNGGHAEMRLTRVSISRSHAGSGGLLANSETSSNLTAVGVTFSHGNATDYGGGAVSSKGRASFESCSFWENSAHNPQGHYPQGATIAILAADAAVTFVNCSVDADRARRAAQSGGTAVPSEFFVGEPGVLLNLTFVNVTNCHRDVLKVQPPNKGEVYGKVFVRGGALCEDGTFEHGSTFDSRALGKVATCAEADAWQCGERAVCTDKLVDPASPYGGIGIGCACPAPEGAPAHAQMWGFAYGGDPAIPGSAGFTGCFEQWDARLAGFATGGSCEVAPAFDAASPAPAGGYACCALRGPAEVPHRPATVEVRARPYGDDHATVAPPATTKQVLSAASPRQAFNATAISFDGLHARSYALLLAWVPGDAHCEAGATNATCFNATGAPHECLSQTRFPIDTLTAVTTCQKDAHSACGYSTFGAECTCPVCLAGKTYACECDGGGRPDGTTVCAADGMSLSACDCAAPYPFYPSLPPSSAPASPGAGIGIAGGAAAVVVGGVIVGAVVTRRRRHERRRRAMQESLLNAAAEDALRQQAAIGGDEPQQQSGV